MSAMNESENNSIAESDLEGELNFNNLQDQQIEESNALPKQINAMIKKHKISKSTKKCMICMDHFEKGEIMKLLPCSHYFHSQCLKPWFTGNSICPTCRFNIVDHFQD